MLCVGSDEDYATGSQTAAPPKGWTMTPQWAPGQLEKIRTFLLFIMLFKMLFSTVENHISMYIGEIIFLLSCALFAGGDEESSTRQWPLSRHG